MVVLLPSCVAVKVFFAMVELVVLEDELLLELTEYLTVPFPVPLLPDVIVNQETLLLALQEHVD